MGNLSLGKILSLFSDRIILVGFIVHAVFHFVVFMEVLNIFEANKVNAVIHSFIHS